ncbi:MAG TPA: ATP-binding protein [Ktedonosporobacter sp.]|nr:ATP-binding protein [Ktedonosporobacter sp.]
MSPLLEPFHLLSDPVHLLNVIALALSIFNQVAFFWLACTVWLNGDRRSMIARVGVVGLGLSTLFFFIHSLLIYSQLAQPSGLVSEDFLWRLVWFPALGALYIWFVIGLHYAALINEGWRRRRPLLLAISAALGCGVLLLLVLNQSTLTFYETMRLLAYSDALDEKHASVLTPLILIATLFICYVMFCAIGPWFTPDRVGRLLRVLWHALLPSFGGRGKRGNKPSSLRHKLAAAFWNDQAKVEQLEEPNLSWHMARPGLLLAALLMVVLIMGFGVLGVWSILKWLKIDHAGATDTINRPLQSTAPATLTSIPFSLMMLDVLAVGAVALIILCVGYAIVRHGILIERPLARRGFFEQWRGIVIVATAVSLFISLLVMLTRSSISGLLIITLLATGTYALFTWSSYSAHDRYVALLRPFLRSTNLRHWLNTDLQKTEQNMEDLFSHLCEDVLEVKWARLIVLAGPLKRSFNYRWSAWWGEKEVMRADEADQREKALPPMDSSSGATTLGVGAYRMRMTLEGSQVICWVVPIYDELGLVARLYLGPREDGSVFTDEDMDLAHACGQRILDTLRDHEAMLVVAGLLRRRIVDVKLLGAQQRRLLHDEILPQMHLSLLRLETLRPFVSNDSAASSPDGSALQEAISGISDAHRRLAAMMRATATSAPHRLERDGMMHAIHTMIEQDFQHSFDHVSWEVSEETMHRIDEVIPPAVAELIFAAVQEALRNAARHARGSDVHRRLGLVVRASCNPHLEVIVADDGVGIHAASSSTTGTGGGLMTHRALLAIAGGSLTIKSASDEGVIVRIFLPAESLR